MRDYNGMRGPVPTMFRAHDWQTCRVLRVLSTGWRDTSDLVLLSGSVVTGRVEVRAADARRFYARARARAGRR